MSVLPLELVLRVADYLQPEDVFNLSLASKSLAYLIRFQTLCRGVLMAYAAHSSEAVRAQKDGDYARGLRALVKRRSAIRMAKPFHVAFLAMGTSFVYTNGVLCYATDCGQLRLLDIKNSADHELVVDVFQMLREQKLKLPDFAHHKLKPIHFGHGVLTCGLSLRKDVYSTRSTSYIIVIRPRTPEFLLFEEQPLHDETIVTTTDKYVFLCRPEHELLWGYWALRQFDLETRSWAHPVPRFVSNAPRRGGRVATTVYEDHFYAVSSTDPLISIRYNDPERMPLGAYHVAWVPLSCPSGVPPQVRIPPAALTQFHSGRMSDDRWNFLRLERDEGTGRLMAIEIRMEYTEDGTDPTRRRIKKVLAPLGANHAAREEMTAVNGILSFSPGYDDGGQIAPSLESSSGLYDYTSVDAGNESNRQGFSSDCPSSQVHTILHNGGDSSTSPHYGISQCFVRSYFSTSNSFVDLVNDTLRNNKKEQLLRLRVMTEIPGGGSETAFWPPRYDPFKPDPRLGELHRIMNPPGFDGDLEWSVDSGSFVYGMRASSTHGQKAFIYVGFDPAVKLHNLAAFNKASDKGSKASEHPGAVGSGGHVPKTQGQVGTGTDEVPRTFPPLGAAWAWMEEPLYFRPRGKNGFDFFG